MKELHFTRKDFRVDWFSGTGGGGQHRNKHQNCCRITHIETGLVAIGQTERDRPSNQSKAFKTLAGKLLAHYEAMESKGPAISTEVIRNYHAERNEVLDKASGLRRPYTEIVDDGELGEMIEARIKARRSDTPPIP